MSTLREQVTESVRAQLRAALERAADECAEMLVDHVFDAIKRAQDQALEGIVGRPASRRQVQRRQTAKPPRSAPSRKPSPARGSSSGSAATANGEAAAVGPVEEALPGAGGSPPPIEQQEASMCAFADRGPCSGQVHVIACARAACTWSHARCDGHGGARLARQAMHNHRYGSPLCKAATAKGAASPRASVEKTPDVVTQQPIAASPQDVQDPEPAEVSPPLTAGSGTPASDMTLDEDADEEPVDAAGADEDEDADASEEEDAGEHLDNVDAEPETEELELEASAGEDPEADEEHDERPHDEPRRTSGRAPRPTATRPRCRCCNMRYVVRGARRCEACVGCGAGPAGDCPKLKHRPKAQAVSSRKCAKSDCTERALAEASFCRRHQVEALAEARARAQASMAKAPLAPPRGRTAPAGARGHEEVA